MDLWIRSQDREGLIKEYATLEVINMETGYFSIYAYINEQRQRHLGEYSTKERALEVLDEIDECMSNAVNSGLNVARYVMPLQ